MVFSIEDVRKKYDFYSKKYELPDFEKLNGEFGIESINRDSFLFLKVVRKKMMERIGTVMNFFEMLLNSTNVPRMYIPFVNSISVEDKQKLDKSYDSLSKLTLSSLELEINSNEEKEAKLIKEIYFSWENIKPNLSFVIDRIRIPIVKERKDKNYFG
jgi:hypothetical protein